MDQKVHINGNSKVDTNLAGCVSEEGQNSSDPLKMTPQNPSDSKNLQVEEGTKIPQIKKFD